MTPYGTEWTSEHDIVSSSRLTRVSLRFGDTGRSLAWGIGVLATDLVHVGRIAAQVSAEVWRQPALDAPPSSTALAAGGLATATLNVGLGGSSDRPRRVGLVLQGGYKSDGYVRGERLHAGPIVRVGLSVTLDQTPRSSEALDQH
jgi:hypothetical protein